MMDITKSREEFEAEFRKQHVGDPNVEMLLEMYNHGTDEEPEIDYYSLAARDAWEWWKLGRESIEVVLEDIDSFSPNDCGDDAVWLTELVRALRTAGIRIKGESDGTK